jgi:hypothetical protein
MGLLRGPAWESHVRALRLVFATPQLRAFWEEFSPYGNFRSDWAAFVDCICADNPPEDPILPWWNRMLLTPH